MSAGPSPLATLNAGVQPPTMWTCWKQSAGLPALVTQRKWRGEGRSCERTGQGANYWRCEMGAQRAGGCPSPRRSLTLTLTLPLSLKTLCFNQGLGAGPSGFKGNPKFQGARELCPSGDWEVRAHA